MLMNDQRSPKGDHHENAEQSPKNGDEHHARDFKIEPKDHDRRHRHTETEGDRLAGRARRLDDVVFENRRIAEPKS